MGSDVSNRTRIVGAIAGSVAAALVVMPFGGAARATSARERPSEIGTPSIAFEGHRDYSEDIYTVDPELKKLHRLTNTPFQKESQPAWSPDHSRLAYFVAPRDPDSDPSTEQDELWTMNSDGSDARLLRSGLGTEPADISWSPNGTRLAFAFHRTQGTGEDALVCSEVWVMDSDGFGGRPILQDQPTITGLDWSPDDRRIVYGLDAHLPVQRTCEGPEGLFTMSDDGSDQHSLGAPMGEHPSWSPDGTTIAFNDGLNCPRPHCGDIWLMGADGSDQRPIVMRGGLGDWGPDWSPTGTQIAFKGSVFGAAELWIVNADGSAPTKVADDAWGTPAW